MSLSVHFISMCFRAIYLMSTRLWFIFIVTFMGNFPLAWWVHCIVSMPASEHLHFFCASCRDTVNIQIHFWDAATLFLSVYKATNWNAAMRYNILGWPRLNFLIQSSAHRIYMMQFDTLILNIILFYQNSKTVWRSGPFESHFCPILTVFDILCRVQSS